MRKIDYCSRPFARNTILLACIAAAVCVGRVSSYGSPEPSVNNAQAATYELGNVISFGEVGGSEKYKRSGWSNPEKEFTWTTGTSAKLLLEVPNTSEPLQLRMRLSGFINPPGLPSQPVEILANGQKIADWQVSSPAEFTATVSAAIASTGELSIEIKTPKAASPKALGVSDDSRILGVNCFEMTLSKSTQ